MTQGTFKLVEHENLGVMILRFFVFKYPEIIKKGAQEMGKVHNVLKQYMMPENEWKRHVKRTLLMELNKEDPAVKIQVRSKFSVCENDDTESA